VSTRHPAAARCGIDRDRQLPVGPARQVQPGQGHPQPVGVAATLGQRVTHRPVPAPVDQLHRQRCQRGHRPVGTEQRVGEVNQGIRPPGQAVIDRIAKPRQHGHHLDAGWVWSIL